MTEWKFRASPNEIDVPRILSEAREEGGDAILIDYRDKRSLIIRAGSVAARAIGEQHAKGYLEDNFFASETGEIKVRCVSGPPHCAHWFFAPDLIDDSIKTIDEYRRALKRRYWCAVEIV